MGQVDAAFARDRTSKVLPAFVTDVLDMIISSSGLQASTNNKQGGPSFFKQMCVVRHELTKQMIKPLARRTTSWGSQVIGPFVYWPRVGLSGRIWLVLAAAECPEEAAETKTKPKQKNKRPDNVARSRQRVR